MKKFVNLSFTVGLVIWFITAVYLSVNSIISIFTGTDPYIAKTIFAGSFVWTLGFGIYNKFKGSDLLKINADMKLNGSGDVEVQKARPGCKTCGKK